VGGEALDVEDGEADALVGELGLGGIGFAAPEAVESVRAEDVWGAFGVEIEDVATIEFDGHGGTSCWETDRQSSRSIDVVEYELNIISMHSGFDGVDA